MRELWHDFRCDESRMIVTEFGPTRVSVAKPTTDAWLALAQVLARHDYQIRDLDTGGYVCRKIRGGRQPSLHSYGIAVDVNWHTNPYLKTPNRRPVRFSSARTQEERALDVRDDRADTDMTRAMVDDVLEIATHDGLAVFAWGGSFQTNKDCMHFQLDVSPKELARGIDWSRMRRHEPEPPTPEEPEADNILEDLENLLHGRSDSMPGLSSEVIALAQASQRKWGVPASVTLAQYIHESSGGRRMPPGSNNPFGIKAARGQPAVAAHTNEVEDGVTVRKVGGFRVFSSIPEAFDAHGALLARSPIYAAAMRHKDDPDEFVNGLKAYGTDPDYVSKIKRVMRDNNLYQYDLPDDSADLPPLFHWPISPPWRVPSDDLQTGSRGIRVEMLQRQLVKLGYPLGEIDGEFGPLTRGALAAFQVENGLTGTGVADVVTLRALEMAPPRALDPARTGATAKDVLARGSVVIGQADNAKIAAWIANVIGALGMVNSAVANAPGAGKAATTQIAIDSQNVAAALSTWAGQGAFQKAVPGVKEIAKQAAQVHAGIVGQVSSQNLLDVIPFLKAVPGLDPIFATMLPGFGGSLLALGLGIAVQLFSGRIIEARTFDHRTAANIGR